MIERKARPCIKLKFCRTEQRSMATSLASEQRMDRVEFRSSAIAVLRSRSCRLLRCNLDQPPPYLKQSRCLETMPDCRYYHAIVPGAMYAEPVQS